MLNLCTATESDVSDTNVQDEMLDAESEHDEALYGRSHDLDGADEADEDEGVDEGSETSGLVSGLKRVSVQIGRAHV